MGTALSIGLGIVLGLLVVKSKPGSAFIGGHLMPPGACAGCKGGA